MQARPGCRGGARVGVRRGSDRAALAVDVSLDPASDWVVRCDRVDFPPGGVAYRHVHPGPGIRRLLAGELTIESPDGAQTYRSGEAWYEGADHPVEATASPSEDTSFVRVLLLPAEWAGKRTIRYLDPADEDRAEAPARDDPLRGVAAAVRSGGQILVDQLELNGVDLAFCLPGESFLPVLDALYDSPIRLVSCRHEQGAANAAEAYGKLTGRPGICIVTRGPGATQAAVGVHTARQDSSPLVLLAGHVPRAFQGREAWQELD